MDIIIWVTDRSTGEDKTINLSLTATVDIESHVAAWEKAHPEYEVSGWDYE